MKTGFRHNLFLLFFSLTLTTDLYAYNGKVHNQISESSVLRSALNTKIISMGYSEGIVTDVTGIIHNEIITQPVIDWITEGGGLEDESLEKCNLKKNNSLTKLSQSSCIRFFL